ncbi:MAG: hypothetical protein AAGI91_03050 [Bacteroidota bacterium]
MKLFASKRVLGAAGVVLSVLLLVLSLVFNTVDRDTLAETMPAVDTAPLTQDVSVKSTAFASEDIKDDVLWLARCIYSETKRPDEQELVAWVVRNRVETGYRGQGSYRDAILDPWQFSAFNGNSPKRLYYSGLDFESKAKGWQTALFIAHDVLHAPAYERPFAKTTRHFYSERSMQGRLKPVWADGRRPVALDREIDPKRFRFYSSIS